MPKVSVCIPTYNSAKYLRQAIESVLSQNYGDCELVVCDNASTDRTTELCRGYESPGMRYVRFEEHSNQAGSFNRCLREARGEFITILHADDYLLPGFLEDRVTRLSGHPEIGLVFGAVDVVDECGLVVSLNRPWPEDKAFAPKELLSSLLCGCIVSPPSLMVRRIVAEKAGPFRTDLNWGHDWEWALRLAEDAGVAYTSQVLAAYRTHGGSGTAEILRSAANGDQELRILRDTLERLCSADRRFRQMRRPAYRSLSNRHMYFAETALLDGLKAAARMNLRYAALSDFRIVTRPTFWAMLMGSAGSANWYWRYRRLRNSLATTGTRV
jgi:glycosyltransferase involved in cell wall biosynthesis